MRPQTSEDARQLWTENYEVIAGNGIRTGPIRQAYGFDLEDLVEGCRGYSGIQLRVKQLGLRLGTFEMLAGKIGRQMEVEEQMRKFEEFVQPDAFILTTAHMIYYLTQLGAEAKVPVDVKPYKEFVLNRAPMVLLESEFTSRYIGVSQTLGILGNRVVNKELERFKGK